jgi:iron complex outermembrane recepter protein
MRTPWVVTTSVLALMGMMPTAALAQAAVEGVATKNPDSNEIIVTAQKRSQSVQDVGAAVSAVSGASLNERGISDPSDLQFITPSLLVGKSQGNTAFTIRGVGFNTVGSPAVAVHIDGVFQPRPSLGDLAQIDVERVEVLRGPQGTLYGRNANGGVINFLTKRPTDEFGGYIKARYASYDTIYAEGVLNAPLGSAGGFRLVVAHKDQGDGFVRNIAGGPDLLDEGFTAVRLAVDANVTDRLKVQLTGAFVHRDGAIYSSLSQTNPRTVGPRGAPFGDLFAFGGNLYAALGAVWTGIPNRTTANDPSSSDRKAFNVTGVLEWDLGGLTLKSISGYQYFSDRHLSDFDGTNVTIYQGIVNRKSETFTQELNLSGSVGPVDAVAGVYYLNEHFSQDLRINQPNGNGAFLPGALLSFQTPYYDSKSVAAFTDLTFNLTDSLRLIGGLRYAEDRQNTFQDFNIFANIRVAPTVVISPGNQCRAALPELRFNSTTPRVGVQFDASDSSMFYANYSEGFKVGGYNTDGTCNDPYLPEEIKAYEVGIKNSFMGGDLTLNATGFFYKYENLQLQQIIGTGVSIINAPKAEILGLELEANLRASRSFSAFASASYLDAKYIEFSNVNGATGVLTPVNLRGNRLNNAPKFSVNLGFELKPELNIAGGSLTLRADGSYRSETFVREFNDPLLERNDPYFIANASITWKSANDQYLVRGFVTNLFDEVYLTQGQWSAPIQSRSVSYNQPRQYGIEMQLNF